jgi:hypothetical protein
MGRGALIQCPCSRVPGNVQFVIDDANEEDWLYAPDTFDYIHTRMLLGCFGNYADVIKRGLKYTKPGGWMESQVVASPIHIRYTLLLPFFALRISVSPVRNNTLTLISALQEIMSSVYCDDSTMTPDWAFAEWTRVGDEAAMRAEKPMRIANKLKRWYHEAGFVDVHEEVFKIPMNSWPKDPHYKHIGRVSSAQPSSQTAWKTQLTCRTDQRT